MKGTAGTLPCPAAERGYQVSAFAPVPSRLKCECHLKSYPPAARLRGEGQEEAVPRCRVAHRFARRDPKVSGIPEAVLLPPGVRRGRAGKCGVWGGGRAAGTPHPPPAPCLSAGGRLKVSSAGEGQRGAGEERRGGRNGVGGCVCVCVCAAFLGRYRTLLPVGSGCCSFSSRGRSSPNLFHSCVLSFHLSRRGRIKYP